VTETTRGAQERVTREAATTPSDAQAPQSVGRVIEAVALALALAGGAAFIALVMMSLWSIVGRKLGFGPVSGDIEIMQAGTAVAAAAFLPHCTLAGEHVRVEFFTEKLPSVFKRALDVVAELMFAAVMGLLAWRTTLSAQALHEAGEVTTLVSLPVWMAVAALVPSLAFAALCALKRALDTFRRRPRAPGDRT
jgi:TRAP-type C4-dicarboxylate transport system permease small subunit